MVAIESVLAHDDERDIIGTVIGSANPSEFRLAVRPGRLAVQDFVALESDEGQTVWARIVEIERINPLFPTEAAQELAFQGLDAYDTVAALSRELVTAKCRVLGVEDDDRLKPLEYPVRPASAAWRPDPEKAAELLAGRIPEHRRLHLGQLRAHPEVPVFIDGQAVVARHLAVLAATGAGKSVAVRRVVEQLAGVGRGYPMVIIDPHGDYFGLSEIWPDRVDRYVASLDLATEEPESVIDLIAGLSGEDPTGPQTDFLTGLVWLARRDDQQERLNALSEEKGGTRLPSVKTDVLTWMVQAGRKVQALQVLSAPKSWRGYTQASTPTRQSSGRLSASSGRLQERSSGWRT